MDNEIKNLHYMGDMKGVGIYLDFKGVPYQEGRLVLLGEILNHFRRTDLIKVEKGIIAKIKSWISKS